jgi:superfamily II DNA/RNA helicase
VTDRRRTETGAAPARLADACPGAGADTLPPFARAQEGEALFSLSARHGGGSTTWPYARGACPDVLVATPSFVASLDRELPLWDSLRVLVLDEADMLLDGGYLTGIERCLVALKRVERARIFGPEADALRCQRCIFAATLPNMGQKSVDMLLSRYFKHAKKVQQADGTAIPMHREVSTLDHGYRQVKTDLASKLVELIPVVLGLEGDDDDEAASLAGVAIPNPPPRPPRTMVFANTAAAVIKALAALEDEGIRAAPYHKDVPPVARLEAFDAFASGRVDVLVCTDLAARGLDLPLVEHVVQLEFALNVVPHLHRVGRAAHAGADGRATSFFDDSAANLVSMIRKSESAEPSFSRRRGFRAKLK